MSIPRKPPSHFLSPADSRVCLPQVIFTHDFQGGSDAGGPESVIGITREHPGVTGSRWADGQRLLALVLEVALVPAAAFYLALHLLVSGKGKKTIKNYHMIYIQDLP